MRTTPLRVAKGFVTILEREGDSLGPMGDDAGTAGTTRVRARVARSMFVASIIGTLVALGFQLTTESRSPSLDEWGLPGAEGLLAIASGVVGFLIVRRTSNPTNSV